MATNQHDEFSPSRRDFLASLLLGTTPLWLSGCGEHPLPAKGELLSPSLEIGHRIRDGEKFVPANNDWEEAGVVIVGGGIAGLSAAWRLQQAGVNDFRVLELEPVVGGTSRSGTSPISAYPWGAHYVPVPQQENRALWQLLEQMQLARKTESGEFQIVAEEALCREPQERLFVNGKWNSGLYPHSIATEKDLEQWEAFGTEIKRWIDWRDDQGRPAFTIPVAGCSTAQEVVRLDQITMLDWLREQGWNSQPLRWLVDYCCRDDYGLTIEQTSVWAGLFYFASRMENSADEEQPLLTWPAGNGQIVQHLAGQLGTKIKTGQAVVSIESPRENEERTKLVVFDTMTQTTRGLLAKQVIFAAPQFLAPHLIRDLSQKRKQSVQEFQYGSWIVANLHLSSRPVESHVPLSWDNVIHNSKSLGYVVATHQVGSDFGPTVWTWYMPLCDPLPDEARRRLLLELKWEHWAEVVLQDLEPAHPEIRRLTEKLDVMRWGHAMIQPRPGFVWSEARQAAAQPLDSIHFAGTDLSGVALMEEAFYHGIRAAEEVLTARNTTFSSLL